MDFKYQMHCRNCGEKFGARRSTALFCGPNCRSKWHRLFNKIKDTVLSASERRRMTKSLRMKSVTCKGCHATFFVSGNNGHRKYHSNACKQKAYRFRCSLVKQWLR